MNCRQCRELLGTDPEVLTNSEVLSVVDHLRVCSTCLKHQEGLEALADQRLPKYVRDYEDLKGQMIGERAFRAAMTDPELPRPWEN